MCKHTFSWLYWLPQLTSFYIWVIQKMTERVVTYCSTFFFQSFSLLPQHHYFILRYQCCGHGTPGTKKPTVDDSSGCAKKHFALIENGKVLDWVSKSIHYVAFHLFGFATSSIVFWNSGNIGTSKRTYIDSLNFPWSIRQNLQLTNSLVSPDF